MPNTALRGWSGAEEQKSLEVSPETELWICFFRVFHTGGYHMKLVKSLLLGSAATLAVVAVANAADLPSKKAAPASYVKICDAYGAGFFYIPGTDTCVKLGGYVRAEEQYVPGQATLSATTGLLQQSSDAQSTTGFEVRGRIDVDARTPTAMGTARTFVRLRLANTSGIRNTKITNIAAYTMGDASTVAPTIESAMVQWAGFTFGIAPENYAMMPSFMYHSNPWTGFPNGMKQVAYTATFAGGWSATLAVEDAQDMNNTQLFLDQASTFANIVGNVRLDQAWGFAAIHGMIGNDSIQSGSTAGAAGFGAIATPGGNIIGQSTYGAWALGVTASFKLPMIAAGDQVWFTANYASGLLSALYSTGGLSNVGSTASDKRLIGGVVRVDQNVIPTSANTFGVITGWNVSAAYTHYWAAQWRSNLTAGYIEINPPTAAVGAGSQWGKGQLWEVAGSLIYSPAKDLDIGLEVQYASLKNQIQNPAAAFVAAGSPGLSQNNWSTKLRVERTF